MKRLPILTLLAVAAAVLALSASCKKKEETVYKNSFSGSLSIKVPQFVKPGDVLTITPTGVSRKDGGTFGYWFKASEGMDKADTTRLATDPLTKPGTLVYTIPDHIGLITINCTAFAEDYYSSTASVQLLVVDDEKTLTGVEVFDSQPAFKDVRDGRVYHYTTIGGKDWMSRNLAWNGAGYPYDDAQAVDYILGRFYTFSEAQTACPDGWALPTDDDWTDLAGELGATVDDNFSILGIAGDLMADVFFADSKFWIYWPQVQITNSTGLTLMPTGYSFSQDSFHSFGGFGGYAAMWTGTEADDGENAVFRYIYEDKQDVFSGLGNKESMGLPVRCVRDHR